MSEPGSSLPVKLSDAILKDDDQLTVIISELEQYSQSLVKNFESTTKQIRQALDDRGSIAAQAVEILSSSQAEVDSILNGSFSQLEGIINAVESLLPAFDGLEEVNNELVLLSDILTTVEEAVQRRQ
jgi:hypothetical protein